MNLRVDHSDTVYQAKTMSTLQPALVSPEEAIELVVGPGETVQSVSLNRGSLAIHVRRPDGSDAIIVYNLARQGVVQRLNIKPQ